jgi:hypothetical protein
LSSNLQDATQLIYNGKTLNSGIFSKVRQDDEKY